MHQIVRRHGIYDHPFIQHVPVTRVLGVRCQTDAAIQQRTNRIIVLQIKRTARSHVGDFKQLTSISVRIGSRPLMYRRACRVPTVHYVQIPSRLCIDNFVYAIRNK